MVTGLILAAGEGRRFGSGSKLLAELAGRPLLEHAVAAQTASPGIDRIVVVLGAAAEKILQCIDFGRAEPVVCEQWPEGQAASLRFGAAQLRRAEKVVVTLGDQPLMPTELVSRLAAEAPPVRAAYGGRPGHPVVLGPDQLRAITSLRGDRGARDLLRGCRTIDCSTYGYAARDVDTPEDLEAIRDEARAVL